MRLRDVISKINPFSTKEDNQDSTHNDSEATSGNSCPSPFDYVSIREVYPHRLWSESSRFGNQSLSTGRKYSFSGTMTEDDFLNCLLWAVPNRQRPVTSRTNRRTRRPESSRRRVKVEKRQQQPDASGDDVFLSNSHHQQRTNRGQYGSLPRDLEYDPNDTVPRESDTDEVAPTEVATGRKKPGKGVNGARRRLDF
ncbi:uncharacterized protein LOC142348747 [Convolutriloba macropyga]|uniref:uncharacterized protein LOC142348747 n=1 Tax=Convolutriloba macropyga TaxID=536237 RepID=UPI003F51F7A3